jgi:hypothetical protein
LTRREVVYASYRYDKRLIQPTQMAKDSEPAPTVKTVDQRIMEEMKWLCAFELRAMIRVATLS